MANVFRFDQGRRRPHNPLGALRIRVWNDVEWQIIVGQSDLIEFDWYGYDRRGHVAAFASFGRGIIPSAVKTSLATYNELFDVIDALSEHSSAELRYDGPGHYDDWLAYSRRGLFAYDGPNGQYSLISVPTAPLTVDSLSLPPRLLAIIPFVDVEFGKRSTLDSSSFPQ